MVNQFAQLLRQFLETMCRRNVYDYCKVLFVLCAILTGYYYIILGCYLNIAGLLTKMGLVTLGGNPIGHDFIAFYSAGKLARSGDPSAIYSVPALHAVQVAVIGRDIDSWSWVYPPTFLLLVIPFSLMPYLLSLLVWIIGTYVGYLLVVRYIAPHPITPWLFLGFPGSIFNLVYGHNGFFSTILLGGGLLLLDRNPIAGGLLLGILSYKPHLAGLLPIAFLAGRCWRALGGFAIGACSLALISLMAFGSSTWIAFCKNIPYAATHWQTSFLWAQMPTIFALARLEGANFVAAAILQGVVTLGAVSALILVWFHGASLALRGSILILSILLSSPYLFLYDLALLGLPFAWLAWELYIRNERTGQILLMVFWVSLFTSMSNPGGKGTVGILLILSAMLFFVLYLTLYSQKSLYKGENFS
jgi:hypothetical protein